MLYRFSVTNFLSFYKKQTFDLIPSKEKKFSDDIIKSGKYSTLKSSLIYGPNASGKSNFIKSIKFSRDLIIKGLERVNTSEKYYKLTKEAKDTPSIFEYEILINGKIYSYGFAVSLLEKKIIQEWLIEVEEKKDKILFLREENNITKENIIFTDEKDIMRFEFSKEEIKPKQLFLTTLADKKWNENYSFKFIKEWFTDNLIIVFPETSFKSLTFHKNAGEFLNFIKIFDTGIDRIDYKEKDFTELDDIPENVKLEINNSLAKQEKNHGHFIKASKNIYELYLDKNNNTKAKEIVFKHENSDINFELSEESDGTRRLIELIPLFKDLKCSSKTILIDELDRSLHPAITTAFLSLFYQLSKGTENQLIVTTHDATLLRSALKRKDEVHLINKLNGVGTNIKTLSSFNDRADRNVFKAYLLGRYGAIPNIKNFNSFIEELGCDEDDV